MLRLFRSKLRICKNVTIGQILRGNVTSDLYVKEPITG